MKSLILPLTLSLLLSTGVFAQDYQIQINRPMKAGEQYRVEVTGTSSEAMSVTSNGTPVKENKEAFGIDYKSIEKVVEVDALGRETKASSTIEKFTKIQEGKKSELLPAGTVVVSSVANQKTVHTINGAPVDPKVAKALDLVLSMSKGGPSDDEAFGTKERKKVGDAWNLNETAIQEVLNAPDAPKAENLAGKGTLVGVVKETGGDVLKLNVHVTGKVLPPLPPTFVVDQASLNMDFSGDYPVNLALGRPNDTVSATFSFSGHANAPSGEKIVIQVDVNKSVNHKQTKL